MPVIPDITTTLAYSNNGEPIQVILLKSFALFLEKEVAQRYNEEDGWLLMGGTSCTLR